MRILIIEDSRRLAESLRAGLRKLGHAVDLAFDGRAGLSHAKLNPHAVIILDVMLPELDGLSVLAGLREAGVLTPVLLLTARDTVADRVKGLRSGADDYLVKPFAFDELAARIEALARRPRIAEGTRVQVGDLHIDLSARVVSRGGRPIALPRREYALLALLASRRGSVVNTHEIEDALYDERSFPASNVVASAISSLRSHLGVAGESELIHTRRGLGYVLDDRPP
jgi:two-component system, OmpR family, copper resistance phosphate regulon response regulator CusR